MTDRAAGVSRRRFIASGVALAGAAAWDPALASAGAPAGFPRDVAVSRRRFENWAQAIDVRGVLTCAPRTPQEVVAAVNWAWRHGYRVRALGRAHTWSPLALAPTPARAPRVLLVDTTRHLTRMRLADGRPGRRRHADGRHDGGAARVPRARRSRADRLPGARGHHDRRRARHRRPRHRRPGARRAGGALRLGQQPRALVDRGGLERAARALRAAHLRPRRSGLRRPAHASRAHAGHQRHAPRRAAAPPPLRQPHGRARRGAVRGARVAGTDVRRLPRGERPGRGDLVPVHRRAVAEGLEREPAPAGELAPGARAVQLPVRRHAQRRRAARHPRADPGRPERGGGARAGVLRRHGRVARRRALGRHLGGVEGRPALRAARDAAGHRERLRHPHAPPGRPARDQRVRPPLHLGRVRAIAPRASIR